MQDHTDIAALQQRLEVLEKKSDTLLILIITDQLDKLITAYQLALVACSLGRSVNIFHTMLGINILKAKKDYKDTPFIGKMFKWMLPAGTDSLPMSQFNMLGMGAFFMKKMMKGKVSPLHQSIKEAVDLGCKIYACTQAIDVLCIKPSEIRKDIPIIEGGLADFLGDGGDLTVFS